MVAQHTRRHGACPDLRAQAAGSDRLVAGAGMGRNRSRRRRFRGDAAATATPRRRGRRWHQRKRAAWTTGPRASTGAWSSPANSRSPPSTGPTATCTRCARPWSGAGAEVRVIHDRDPDKLALLREDFPDARVAASEQEVLDDPEVKLVAAAAVPCDRGAVGERVMRSGKDYFTDKCPFTTLAQLASARAAAAETGRKFMVYYGERLHNEGDHPRRAAHRRRRDRPRRAPRQLRPATGWRRTSAPTGSSARSTTAGSSPTWAHTRAEKFPELRRLCRSARAVELRGQLRKPGVSRAGGLRPGHHGRRRRHLLLPRRLVHPRRPCAPGATPAPS